MFAREEKLPNILNQILTDPKVILLNFYGRLPTNNLELGFLKKSSSALIITDQVHNLFKIVVILDWDDTLVPTSYLHDLDKNKGGIEEKHIH